MNHSRDDIEREKDHGCDNSSANNTTIEVDAEKRFGICMILLLIAALPFNYYFSLLSLACAIMVIVLSGNIVRGCCCYCYCSARQYSFEPHVRKWAKTILGSVIAYAVLWSSLTFYYHRVPYLLPRNDTSSPYYDDENEEFSISQTVITILSYVCLIVALVFSVLFTWGKAWKHIVT